MEIKEQLAGVSLFKAFDDAQREKMARIARLKEFMVGDYVFQAGDAGDSIYAIVDGAVSVMVIEEGGEETEVTILHNGSYFGEMEVIESGMTRSASIVAKEKASLLRFDASDLHDLLESDDALAKVFYRTVSKELIRRLRDTTQHMGYFKARSISF